MNRSTDPAFFLRQEADVYGFTRAIVFNWTAALDDKDAYLLDTVGRNTRPFSLFFRRGRVVFRIIDSDGHEKSHVIPVQENKGYYAIFQHASSARGIFSSLIINGDELVLQQGMAGARFEQIERATIGADIDGKFGFNGRLYRHIELDDSLTILERLELSYYFEKEYPLTTL